MPKIHSGGVSNQIVDPDFIAEPGVPVEKAVDEGLNDVGQEGVHVGDEPKRADDENVEGDNPERDENTATEDEKRTDDKPAGAQDRLKQSPAKKAAPAKATQQNDLKQK